MEIAFLPYTLFRILGIRKADSYHWNILLSNLLVLFLFAFSGMWFSRVGQIPHFCLFDRLTGLPCPFCGTTTALSLLMQGELGAAFSSNRVAPLLLLFLLGQVLYRSKLLLSGGDLSYTRERSSRVLSLILLILFFINWIYNIINIYFII